MAAEPHRDLQPPLNQFLDVAAEVNRLSSSTHQAYPVPHLVGLPPRSRLAQEISADAGTISPDSEPIEDGAPASSLITDPEDILAARQLTGATYFFEQKYVTELTDDGCLTETDDPYVPNSTYFATKKDGAIVATSRALRFDSIDAFPAIAEFDVDTASLPDNGQDVAQFVEISALAKRNDAVPEDVARLYASMMKWSLDSNVRYWLMGADNRFIRSFNIMFGTGLLAQIGNEKKFLGSLSTPMMLDTMHGVQEMRKAEAEGKGSSIQKRVRKAFLDEFAKLTEQDLAPSDGTPYEASPREERPIPIDERQFNARKLLTGKNLAMLALSAYVAGRAALIPITSLDQHGVNTLVFLALDLGTIPPYVHGLAEYNNNKLPMPRRLGGLAVAAASFVLPYAYAAIAGHEAPQLPEATLLFAATVLGSIAVKKVYGKLTAAWANRTDIFGRSQRRPKEKQNKSLEIDKVAGQTMRPLTTHPETL